MSDIVWTRRSWKWWTRTVHLYLSLCGMVLMLFFGLTGFVMNHEHWFGMDDSKEETVLGEVPLELLAVPQRLEIVELLRSRYGARGRVTEFELVGRELRIEIEKPGRSSEILIDRDGGFMTMEIETDGALETLADLHQGKHTGTLGSLMIDIASVTLFLAALTGLMLWITLPKRRRLGIAALSLSFLLFASFYWYVVG